MELEAVRRYDSHTFAVTRTHSQCEDTTAWKRYDSYTHSQNKDTTRTHIRMNKDTTRTHIRMNKDTTRTHIRMNKDTTRTYSESYFQTRSLIFSLFLEMDTCSVQIVVVSTRVDEQLISILRNSEERRKCLEPSNVMDQIVVLLS